MHHPRQAAGVFRSADEALVDAEGLPYPPDTKGSIIPRARDRRFKSYSATNECRSAEKLSGIRLSGKSGVLRIRL